MSVIPAVVSVPAPVIWSPPVPEVYVHDDRRIPAVVIRVITVVERIVTPAPAAAVIRIVPAVAVNRVSVRVSQSKSETSSSVNTHTP